jgi:hypothetical protein
MATKLEKNVVRESSVEFDERNVIVTLSDEQQISMKLKGMRKGDVSIGIDELYAQLTGSNNSEGHGSDRPKYDTKQMPLGTSKTRLISLDDLMRSNLISDSDYPVKVQVAKIIKDLIERYYE